MPTIATIRPVTSGGNNTLNRLTILAKIASETPDIKVIPYKRDKPPVLEATRAAAKFVGEQTGGHRYPVPIGPFGRAMIIAPIPPAIMDMLIIKAACSVVPPISLTMMTGKARDMAYMQMC
jgi:hypothetical protein